MFTALSHIYFTFYHCLHLEQMGLTQYTLHVGKQLTHLDANNTLNMCKNGHSQKDRKLDFKTNIIASCRSKVLQNAPRGAFCNTFDLH